MIDNKNFKKELNSLDFYQNINNFLKNKNELNDEVLEW